MSTKKLLTDISRLVDEVISLEELKTALNSGKKLTIKYGVDCTAPFLHLGHAVNLWVMRRFQDEGHKVVFLIGNFTSRIGDPTGKSQTRKVLTLEEIEASASEFIKQVSSILITDDPEVFEIRRNAEWFDCMSLGNFLNLCSMTTHAKLISREMFKNRIKSGTDIHIHELLYPLLQGYDSVMLNSDLTVVGSDQLFNEMMGRFYQERFGQTPQIVMTTKITKGLWGEEKQSKSIGNFVALNDTSKDKFGKVMKLADDRIIDWMKVYTDIPLEEIEEIESKIKDDTMNPRDAKIILAHAIVKKYHGIEVADMEKNVFEDTFSRKIFPSDAKIITILCQQMGIIDLLVRCCDTNMSKSELRRLIKQGAVQLDDQKVTDENETLSLTRGEHRLKIGKRRFFKVIVN